MAFLLLVLKFPTVAEIINDGDTVEASTIARAIISNLGQVALDSLDIILGAGSIVTGIMGLFAVLDREGIYNYTDRAMIKIVIYMNASLLMAFLCVLRVMLEIPFLVNFEEPISWQFWVAVVLGSFSCYHAFVIWSFYERLKLQREGSFDGPPAMHGQRPPGLIVEFSHFQGTDILVPKPGSGDHNLDITIRRDINPQQDHQHGMTNSTASLADLSSPSSSVVFSLPQFMAMIPNPPSPYVK